MSLFVILTFTKLGLCFSTDSTMNQISPCLLMDLSQMEKHNLGRVTHFLKVGKSAISKFRCLFLSFTSGIDLDLILKCSFLLENKKLSHFRKSILVKILLFWDFVKCIPKIVFSNFWPISLNFWKSTRKSYLGKLKICIHTLSTKILIF